MAKIEIEQATPKWFQLRTVVFSHGWYDLPPFEWREETQTLATAAMIAGEPTAIDIEAPRSGLLRISAQRRGRTSPSVRTTIAHVVARSLGWQKSFEDFYRLAGKEYAWAKQRGAGPFLRGASVFEDAVKMLATTNCSWALTRQMMHRLVDHLGQESPTGRKSFPTPQAMADQPALFYREVVRAGYRASFFEKLAHGVVDGSIDVESWCQHQGPIDDLLQKIRQAPGLGRYAAENLAKLMGRFDGLGLDSWCLKKYPQLFGPIQGNVTQAIEQRYERFGCWKGLALWLDLTRDWHEEVPARDPTAPFQKR